MSIANNKHTRKTIVTRSLALFFLSSIVLWGSIKTILYFYDIKTLGIWGLILTYVNSLKLFDFGVTSTLAALIPKTSPTEKRSKTINLIISSLLINSSVLILLLIVLVGISESTLSIRELLFNPKIIKNFDFIYLILPALFMNTISQSLSGVLDGFKRSDLKNIAILSGQFCFVVFILIFNNHNKELAIFNLSKSYLIQSLIIFLITFVFVIKLLLREEKDKYKFVLQPELLSIGKHFQVINFSSLFYEPVTKIYLQNTGNLEILGHFEIAQKMLQQGRAIIQTVYQSSIGFFAENFLLDSKLSSEKFKFEQIKYQKLLMFLSLTALISLPLFSYLFFKSINFEWFKIMIILGIGNLISLISLPKYYLLISTLQTSFITKVHIEMAALNIFFCATWNLSKLVTFSNYDYIIIYSLVLCWGGWRIRQYSLK